MGRRRRPKQFQYLDIALTESYLSDLSGELLEGGSSTRRVFEGDEGSSESRENYRYSPEALFRLLHEELDRETDEGKILVHLDSFNRSSWDELLDGDIVQITGSIKLPEILQAVEGAKGIERLLPLMEKMGDLTGEDMAFGEKDLNMLSGLKSMQEIIEAQNASVIIIEVAKSPRYRFVAKLLKDNLHRPLDELIGEAKIVGSVNRKIDRGDPPIGLEQLIPEFGSLKSLPTYQEPQENRAARRRKGQKAKEEEDAFSIGYPAATLTPIGIFR